MRYRPVSARFKVYIIDEVHMLSKNAFNALLKTLEEPPPDVKFVFATTEVHRVPVTVLSRCQRFALRRVPVEQLVQHYRRVAEAEGIAVEPGALGLIARAADGSVRDGLSLLDQAIALSAGQVEEAAVRDMLGIADRNAVFDLLETVLRGDAAGALDRMDALYQGGADPQIVLQDLLDLSHFVTRLKLAPGAGADDPLEAGDRERARPLAAALSMPVLARAWQMLLKGLEEVQTAPSPAQAAAMVLVRLAYVADLPAPVDLVRTVTTDSSNAARQPAPQQAPSPPAGERVGVRGQPAAAAVPSPDSPLTGRATLSRSAGEGLAAAVAVPADPVAVPTEAPAFEPMPQSFVDVVALFEAKREALLRAHLWAHVHLVAFQPGRIEFRKAEGAPDNLANRVSQLLSEWTGTRWLVAYSESPGAPTLAEAEALRERELRNEVTAHPLVRAVLETFPGAKIEAVRDRFAGTDPGAEAAIDDGGDEDMSAGEDEA